MRVIALFCLIVAIVLVMLSCVPPTTTPTAHPPSVTASPRPPVTVTPLTSQIESPTPPTSPLEFSPQAKTPTPKPTPACGLLTNCSFEEPYNCPAGATCVADGWDYWYVNPPPCWAGAPGCYIQCPRDCMGDENESKCFGTIFATPDPKKCVCKHDMGYGCWWQQPEFARVSLQFPQRVHSGMSAQKMFGWGRMIEGGLLRQVSVQPDKEYEFSIHAQAWMCYTCTTGLTDWPKDFHLKIGIDPTGGTVPTSTQIIWSPEVNSWDAYARLSVRSRPAGRGMTMTLFTAARADWGNDHLAISNDVYLDDAHFGEAHNVYLPVIFKW